MELDETKQEIIAVVSSEQEGVAVQDAGLQENGIREEDQNNLSVEENAGEILG